MNRRDEALLERRVLERVGSDRSLALFKNEVGLGYHGNAGRLIVTMVGGVDAKLARNIEQELGKRRIYYGLHTGSADLIGCLAVTIRPEHVGMVLGRFVSAELKSERGRLSDEQETWLRRMRELGALAGVYRDEDELAADIERAK